MTPAEHHRRLRSRGKFLVTAVDFGTIKEVTGWILSNRPEKSRFTLLINSSGGSPTSACYFSSIAAMFSKEVRLTGVAFGECGSAALALLQCCHERVAVKNCGFFIHHIRSTVSCRKNLDKLRIQIEEDRNLEETLVKLQCKRSGLSRKQWMKLADEGEESNSPLFASQALTLGLIDKIVDRYSTF